MGDSRPLFGIQPHSSIAILTVVLSGELSFEDMTGGRTIRGGGFAWMTASRGTWHSGGSEAGEPLRVFQLWISRFAAQPPRPAASEGITPEEVEQDGPVRVILGEFGRARSRIRSAALTGINCFHVHLKDGQRWRYVAPEGHNVTWLAVDRGGLQLRKGERVYWEQLALFADSAGAIEMQADGETSFVLGSARRHSPPAADILVHTAADGVLDSSLDRRLARSKDDRAPRASRRSNQGELSTSGTEVSR